jgi:sugar phosphate isomerase/epimerase
LCMDRLFEVDPAIQNSNTPKFRGPRLRVAPTENQRFPNDLVLEAVRQFMQDHGLPPTPETWTAAGMIPSEKTVRRRFGSFRNAAEMAKALGVRSSASG